MDVIGWMGGCKRTNLREWMDGRMDVCSRVDVLMEGWRYLLLDEWMDVKG